MKIRVADYVAQRLRAHGVRTVFLLSGTAIMPMIDALGRPGTPGFVCHHHEQAAAMAADAAARLEGGLGVCYTNSGPAATNMLTGLVGAYQDSSPVLFITGQVRRSQLMRRSPVQGLRQLGSCEVDILPMVASVTKYAAPVDDPRDIRRHLDRALRLATTGRPGPVLLDIPQDVQMAGIDPDTLGGDEAVPLADGPDEMDADRVLERLRRARRPLVLGGWGIRASGATGRFRALVARWNVPVVTTQMGKDILPYDHPLFVGHPGVKGDRAGNMAVHHADLLVALGSSLHLQTTGYDTAGFAPRAHRILVDPDPSVLERAAASADDLVCCDVRALVEALWRAEEGRPRRRSAGRGERWHEWREVCARWKSDLAVMNEPHRVDETPVSYYSFVDVLSREACGDETIVVDGGLQYYVMGHAFRVKGDQRYIACGAQGAMGFALPAALGCSLSSPRRATVCVTGDGGLQLNIQELQTLRHHGANVKLFVMDNGGYVSIRNVQEEQCQGRLAASSPETGVSLPSLSRLAAAYGIPFIRCASSGDLPSVVRAVLDHPGPVLCEVVGQADQRIMPSLNAEMLPGGKMRLRSLCDMEPPLARSVGGALEFQVATSRKEDARCRTG